MQTYLGIYIDTEDYPINPDRFLSLLEELKGSGFNVACIAFGRTFPFRLQGRFCSPYYYPEKILDGLIQKAHKLDIAVVPVLPSLSDFSSFLAARCFSTLRQGLSLLNRSDYIPTLRSMAEDMAGEIMGVIDSPGQVIIKLDGHDSDELAVYTTPLARFIDESGAEPLLLSSSISSEIPFPSFVRNTSLEENESFHSEDCGGEILKVRLKNGKVFILIVPDEPLNKSPLGFEICLPSILEAGMRLSEKSISEPGGKKAESYAGALDAFTLRLKECWDLVASLDTAYYAASVQGVSGEEIRRICMRLREGLDTVRINGQNLSDIGGKVVDSLYLSSWVWARTEALHERAHAALNRFRIFRLGDQNESVSS